MSKKQVQPGQITAQPQQALHTSHNPEPSAIKTAKEESLFRTSSIKQLLAPKLASNLSLHSHHSLNASCDPSPPSARAQVDSWKPKWNPFTLKKSSSMIRSTRSNSLISDDEANLCTVDKAEVSSNTDNLSGGLLPPDGSGSVGGSGINMNFFLSKEMLSKRGSCDQASSNNDFNEEQPPDEVYRTPPKFRKARRRVYL
jgi:hypothetical protein